jgi:murein DD-endopeptidase MepM/ murein hydrolase activator NlpD
VLSLSYHVAKENKMNGKNRPTNKNQAFAFFICLLCCAVFFADTGQGILAEKFYSPFNDADRASISSVQNRLIGRYGEYRRSYKPGHLHAGVDLKGSYRETVFAIGPGQVYQIFREFPHKSVIVKHTLQEDEVLYSVYTHVEDIEVDVGDWVDQQTPLARLFNQYELEQADFGTPNHLHLEIRTDMTDAGQASYASMTKDELDKFCMDPMDFFRANLQK